MPVPVLLLPILALAAQASQPSEAPVIVTGRPWAPFISPMGEPFRARKPGEDTLARWFYQADRNRDGMLRLDEMQADADHFFAKLDTSHDGVIEPDEITAYEWEVAPEIQVGSRWRRSNPAATAAPTPQADSSEPGDRRSGRRRGSGRHDAQSSDGLDYGLQGAARYALLNIPQPVAAADTNFDRGITVGEFRQAAVERFNLLDTARTGRLTLAELQAMRPAGGPPGRLPKRNPKAVDKRIGNPLPSAD